MVKIEQHTQKLEVAYGLYRNAGMKVIQGHIKAERLTDCILLEQQSHCALPSSKVRNTVNGSATTADEIHHCSSAHLF